MKIKYFLLTTFYLIPFSVQAKFYEPESQGQFYKYVEERHNLVIVLFEPYDVTDQDKMEDMSMAFERLARRDRYKDTDVAFIAVELDELPELVTDFSLSIKKPTVMLFKNGEVLKKKDEIVKDVGYLNKIELEDFIEEYFATAIDEKLKRQKEIERIRQEERQKQEQQSKVLPSKVIPAQQRQPEVKYVSYPSQSTTYVYDDDYGYGGPSIGIGLGVPFWGGYGYRRPWRGYGPRRGFGGGYRRGFGGRGFGGRRGGGRGGRGRR